MPSVTTKRSTKVLVLKGASEGARVLRSGRRLWPDSDEGKPGTTAGDRGDWSSDVRSSQGTDGAFRFKGNGWHRRSGLKKQEVVPMKLDAQLKPAEPLNVKLESNSSAERIWGSVYQRKRKGFSEKRNGDSNKRRSSEDSMYGKRYVRRQLRKTMVRVRPSFLMLAAAVDPSRGEISWFVPFLGSVLGYMMRVRVKMRELSAFLLTGSVHDVFTSHGVHFSRVHPCSGSGNCKIFGMVQSGPSFSVDFSAVPSCFLYMQLNMLLRSRYLPSMAMEANTQMDDEDNVRSHSSIISNQVNCGIKTLFSRKFDTGKRRVLIITPPKLDARNSYHRRNRLNLFNVQRRRRSMRLTRARKSSSLSIHKASGSMVPSIARTRSSGSPSSSEVSGHRLRNKSLKISSLSNTELKTSSVGVREDIYSTGCLANLLICEPDRCYREEGVSVMLEYSSFRQWVLGVKRDGSVLCSHVAQTVMRPCACNPFTHAMIWTGEDGWKLEFLNQWDWLNFTELYKECCDRNENAPTAKIVPVPGVCEVSGYDDVYSTFIRPETYIRVNGDEVSRAMAKRTPNYDIDSEDEEWLSKFNDDIRKVNEHWVDVSVATLELMVDTFERAHFCSPDDYADVNAAAELFMDLERREVIEAVYRYWMRKRKQKHSALVRIFRRHHQPREAQLLPKPVLRKRRSYKRQASQAGRGKHRTARGRQQLLALQVVTAEQDAFEEQSAMVRVEEAQRLASRSVELAIEKRKRAQVLMEFASLTMYRATMAVRIAEAAPVMGTTDAAMSAFFID